MVRMDKAYPFQTKEVKAAWNKKGIKSGAFLEAHCDSAHGGKEDPKCNACKELKAKMEKVNGH